MHAMPDPYVRVAEIEIDPAQFEAYQAALKQEIEAAVQLEAGVLSLMAVHAKNDPARIFVFEVYADVAAYAAHLETPHFATYKAATKAMVKSLKLTETVPIKLGIKRG
jgi:quinol monooxygenase YgiN